MNVIKETARGYALIPLRDELYSKRTIYICGEITQELADDFIMSVNHLASMSHDTIRVYIDSPGGSVTAGLSIYDVLMSCNCPIETICLSQASSIANIIFLAGSVRRMYQHSIMFVHEPAEVSSSIVTTDSAQTRLEILAQYRSTVTGIIAERTGKKVKDVAKLMHGETRLTAEDALKHNMCTEIIS